jgi:Relaxase/Mobilisation nuclease domain.
VVAKISLGNSLYRALVYNSEKINKEDGRLLATNKIYKDGTGRVNINRAYQDFKGWMPTATRTERPMVHISLNPHPEDVLTDAEFTLIAREYLEKMGFADMPYMVYKHSDIARHHIHIVALRVKTDGTCVSDRNNFYKSKDICRELEKKYGLKSAERQKITPDMPISKIDPNGDIKRQVANTVKMVGMRWKFQTLGEYNAILSLYNVRCEEADGRVNGREYHGLVYFATDDDGKTITSPFKASRLGKFSGREAIEQRYLKAKEKIDIEPTKRMVADVMNATASKEDFIAGLKEKNIDLVLRYTEEERIYGATFIDHNTKTVLNGSRLGKEFSANALERRFNNPQERPMPLLPDVQQPQHDNTRQSAQPDAGQPPFTGSSAQPNSATASQSQNRRPQSNANDYENAPSIPGLDLFHVGPGFNAEEEAFYREMQRRKKKKRRGLKL